MSSTDKRTMQEWNGRLTSVHSMLNGFNESIWPCPATQVKTGLQNRARSQ